MEEFCSVDKGVIFFASWCAGSILLQGSFFSFVFKFVCLRGSIISCPTCYSYRAGFRGARLVYRRVSVSAESRVWHHRLTAATYHRILFSQSSNPNINCGVVPELCGFNPSQRSTLNTEQALPRKLLPLMLPNLMNTHLSSRRGACPS